MSSLRLLPNTLAIRIMASLVITPIIIVLGLMALREMETAGARAELDERIQARISVAMVGLLGATPDREERHEMLDRMRSIFPFFDGRLVEEPGSEANANYKGIGFIREYLGPDFRVWTETDTPITSAERRGVIITTPDGEMMRIGYRFGTLRLVSTNSIVLAAATIAALLVFFAWLSHSLTRQLGQLSKAANDFVPDGSSPPIPVTGPEELRRLARTFNSMKDRITLLVSSQAVALMAVGHDLRTPTTRLRIRAEQITDKRLKADILRDLTYMDDMIGDVLSVLRREDEQERAEPTNIAAILETVCDDFTDLGHIVEFEGPTDLVLRARSEDVLRIVTNLVGNATRYGSSVWVTLMGHEDQRSCTILVDDNGPGLPPDDRDSMLRVFRQRQGASNSTIGLGLYIADTVARAHGGGVTLLDSPRGGLRAQVTIASIGQQPSERALEPPKATEREGLGGMVAVP